MICEKVKDECIQRANHATEGRFCDVLDAHDEVWKEESKKKNYISQQKRDLEQKKARSLQKIYLRMKKKATDVRKIDAEWENKKLAKMKDHQKKLQGMLKQNNLFLRLNTPNNVSIFYW